MKENINDNTLLNSVKKFINISLPTGVYITIDTNDDNLLINLYNRDTKYEIKSIELNKIIINQLTNENLSRIILVELLKDKIKNIDYENKKEKST